MSQVAAAEAADNRPVAAGIPAVIRNLAAVSAVEGLAVAAASAAADSPATVAGPGYDPGYSPGRPFDFLLVSRLLVSISIQCVFIIKYHSQFPGAFWRGTRS